MKGDEVARHDTESALYQQQLEQYVYTYLEQKYTVENILSHLVSQGHEEAQVKAALHSVNSKYYHNSLEISSSHSPVKKLLVAGVIVVILCVGAFVFFSSPSYEFFITLDTTRLSPSDPLAFSVVTTRTTSLNVLVETASGNFVLEQNDELDVSERYFVWLPNSLPTGFYTAQVTQTYQGEDTLHTFSFQITADTLPSSQQDLVSLSLAVEERDVTYCQGIISRALADECYYGVSLELRDETVCGFIASPLEKDRCYFGHILNGRALSCELIENGQIRDSCEAI